MTETIVTLVAVCLVTILGDYLIKLGTTTELGLRSIYFVIGASIYGATAFHLMKSNSLATIGVMYSSSMVLLLAALGVVVFKEPLEPRQYLGGLLAIFSVIVMG